MSDLEPWAQILVYRDGDGNANVYVRFDGGTVWLTQAQLVELFDSSKASISEHISNIFAGGELEGDRTVRDFRTVRRKGGRDVQRMLTHYNLEMIISGVTGSGPRLRRSSGSGPRSGFANTSSRDSSWMTSG